MRKTVNHFLNFMYHIHLSFDSHINSCISAGFLYVWLVFIWFLPVFKLQTEDKTQITSLYFSILIVEFYGCCI